MQFHMKAISGQLALSVLAVPVAAATLETSGTFETQNQNMWGPSGGVSIEEDFYAVRTGVLPERTIGDIKEVDNPARTAYDLSIAPCNALSTYTGGTLNCASVTVPGIGPAPTGPTAPTKPSFARPTGLDALNPFSAENKAWQRYDAAVVSYGFAVTAHEADVLTWRGNVGLCTAATGLSGPECVDGFKPFGEAPPATLADGAQLTISDAELELGVRARLDIADGKVDATQDFTVTLDVPDGEFEAGDEVVIEVTGSLGDGGLASRFEVIDAGLDALTKLTVEGDIQQLTLGVETLNEKIIDIGVENSDGSAVATELLGLTIGDGDISGNLFGLSGTIDLSEGISKEIRTPITPGSSIGFSVADVTAYVPDLDLDEVKGPTPLVGDITPTARTGSGETPIDFLKTDIDMDVVTAFNGAPLGVGGGIPLALDVQLDLGDADLGAFFGITQKQTLTGGTIEVVLNFSAPTEVETSPGSGIFETVTQKVVTLGQDVKIKHPGDNLQVTPEYRLVDARYANLTQSVISPVVSVALLNFGLSGLIPEALGVSGFTLFEETIELGDPQAFATLFDEEFDLLGFNTFSGDAFTLAARSIGIAPVPLPASAWLLIGGIAAMFGRRLRRTGSALPKSVSS